MNKAGYDMMSRFNLLNNSKEISKTLYNDLISFVVPVYNNEDYIEKCIKSIKNQGLKYFEIIFINDNSKDNSKQIINTFAKNNSYIKLINNSKNLGPSASRNIGLKKARGVYIRFVDCDDELPKNSTLELYKELKKHKINFIRGTYEEYVDSKKIFELNFLDYQVDLDSDCEHIVNSLKGHWCFLFNRKFLIKNNIKYNENVRFGEDTLFLQQIFKQEKIIYIYNI